MTILTMVWRKGPRGDESEATGDVYETTTPGAGTDELDLDQVFTAGVEAIHQGRSMQNT